MNDGRLPIREGVNHPMIDIDELLRQAISNHQQGELAQAETLYRQILTLAPQQPDALHLLGVLALQGGAGSTACELIQQAIRLRPNEAIYYSNLALAYEIQGAKAQAIDTLRHAIRLSPGFAEAHNNLGKLLREVQQLTEAESSIRIALKLRRNYADAWINLGVLQLDRFAWTEAEDSLREALRLAPDAALAKSNLVIALMEQGKERDALGILQQQLQIEPNSALAFHDLGTVYLKLRQFPEAIRAFELALTRTPQRAASWIHLGCALHECERFEAALEAFRRGLAIEPAKVEAYFNLGRTLIRLERYSEAIQALEQALAIRPAYTEARSLLVNQLQHTCEWGRVHSLSEELIASVRSYATEPVLAPWSLVNPSSFTVLPIPTSNELLFQSARRWSQLKFPVVESTHYAYRAQYPTGGLNTRISAARAGECERIRIGYMSADFRQHVMATHLVELFEFHDRKGFEIFGYSIGIDDHSLIRQRIATSMDHWIDAYAMTTDELIDRIVRDRIDILVDLQGYSDGGRLEVLAHKPAPVQVTYLGFPCTLGCDFVDYALVDSFVAPVSSQPYFSEKLVQLPGCYQVNPRKLEVSGTRPTRAVCGLPVKAVVFAAFNNFFKITPKLFAIWMKILDEVVGSVLWLPSHIPSAVENLRREAHQCGIDGSRLVFAKHLPLPEHVARLPLADLFLDTYPYSAHGTAALSLRAGVPIVTLVDETMASRVAGSLLHELRLDELIAKSTDEYHRLAVRLGTDHDTRSKLRCRLLNAVESSSLFDCQAFARKMEAAFDHMHRRRIADLPPTGFCFDEQGKVYEQSE